MSTVLPVLDTALAALRVIFLAGAIVVGVVCVVDWLVRTRRLSPFSPVSRFFRSSIDPLMAPVERRVVRSGGLPTSAPWWALAAVVFGGIVVLSLLGFVRGQLYGAMFAVQEGPRGLVRLLIAWAFELLRIAIIVRVVISWVRISPYSKWVRWAFVLSEPILRPLRQVIPNLGMIDITPIVAYLLLGLLQSFVVGMV